MRLLIFICDSPSHGLGCHYAPEFVLYMVAIWFILIGIFWLLWKERAIECKVVK